MVLSFLPSFLSRAARQRAVCLERGIPRSEASPREGVALTVAERKTGPSEYESTTLKQPVVLEDMHTLPRIPLPPSVHQSDTESDPQSPHSLRTPSPVWTSHDQRPFIFGVDHAVDAPYALRPHDAHRDVFAATRQYSGDMPIMSPKPVHPDLQVRRVIEELQAAAVRECQSEEEQENAQIHARGVENTRAFDREPERPTLGWGTLDIRSLWACNRVETPAPLSGCMASLMEDDLILYLEGR
ncbi:hypothetical protein DENSPDRAFT_875672 [Dentipellis sp. KUC8613]|nr:hypothetical protein DENSPDRAFT_875672 [Dentipellis sp. KUC8613]